MKSNLSSAPRRRLEGKVALVVGGTRGIGRGIVEALASEGATTILLGRDERLGRGVAESLCAAGSQVEFVACNALELTTLRRAVEAVPVRHGRLDVLVNNAGIGLGLSLLDSTEEAYDQHFDLNVKAAFFAMKWGAQQMAQTGGGSIVNITSVAGSRGYAERTLYCGTKAALIQMSAAAALDVASLGIRINCVSPGTIDTELLRDIHFTPGRDADDVVAELGARNPLGRVGTVEDIARAAVYLASDESAWVTGIDLRVDGGFAI